MPAPATAPVAAGVGSMPFVVVLESAAVMSAVTSEERERREMVREEREKCIVPRSQGQLVGVGVYTAMC